MKLGQEAEDIVSVPEIPDGNNESVRLSFYSFAPYRGPEALEDEIVFAGTDTAVVAVYLDRGRFIGSETFIGKFNNFGLTFGNPKTDKMGRVTGICQVPSDDVTLFYISDADHHITRLVDMENLTSSLVMGVANQPGPISEGKIDTPGAIFCDVDRVAVVCKNGVFYHMLGETELRELYSLEFVASHPLVTGLRNFAYTSGVMQYPARFVFTVSAEDEDGRRRDFIMDINDTTRKYVKADNLQTRSVAVAIVDETVVVVDARGKDQSVIIGCGNDDGGQYTDVVLAKLPKTALAMITAGHYLYIGLEKGIVRYPYGELTPTSSRHDDHTGVYLLSISKIHVGAIC